MALHAVLVRHGETEWSATGRHTSRTDLPLTDAGRRQAEALRPVLARWRFSLVLTSPLQRSVETATLAGLDHGVEPPIERIPDMQEWDYGEAEGRTTAEIRADHPGWTVWDGPLPGGETIQEVTARAERVLARCRMTEGDVALVAHGHFLRILAARWLGLLPQDGRLLVLDSGSISVLGFEHETPAVLHWNDTPTE